jgi:hypothetical protein
MLLNCGGKNGTQAPVGTRVPSVSDEQDPLHSFFSFFLGFHIYIRKKIGILHLKTDIFSIFLKIFFSSSILYHIFAKCQHFFTPPENFVGLHKSGMLNLCRITKGAAVPKKAGKLL